MDKPYGIRKGARALSDYTPREALEHEQRARELLEHSSEALRLVPMVAAVLAVLAGLSSLYGSRLGEHILTLKNEAVLQQVAAADVWAQYQAESLKAHLYAVGATNQTGAGRAALVRKAASYRSEQPPLRAQARADERARDVAMAGAERSERSKVRMDAAIALFEIAIVLTSVAALTKRSWLLLLACGAGLVGLIIAGSGLL